MNSTDALLLIKMKTMKGNIWNCWENDCTIIIPTNGFVKKDGSCVMGKGLALQAKNYCHHIEYILGRYITCWGNQVYYLGNDLVSFPVKHNWWEKADLKLIEKSAKQLKKLSKLFYGYKIDFPIYLPKVGCGNGKLNWKDVEPILDKHLDDRFIIVDLK